MSDGTVNDASVKFESKSSLAELDTGHDELRLIRDTVAGQVPAFYGDVADLSPKLHQTVEQELNGMKTAVVDLYEESGDIATSKVSELGYGVHYSAASGSKAIEPHLMVSTGAVRAMYDIINPLFVIHSPVEITRANQLRAASSMVTWMGLGKWAFDEVNPRLHGSLDHQQSAALLLCLNENLHPNGLPDLDDQDAVEASLDIKLEMIKRRMVGAFAYRGLSHAEFEGDISYRPDGVEITIFEAIFTTMIKRKIEQKERLGMSVMELSLGLAYKRDELVAAANFFADSKSCWSNSAFDPESIELPS